MLFLAILTIFLIFPAFSHADNLSSGECGQYSLNVSFDVQASQVRGQARITVKKGEDLKLFRGNLHILELTVNKQRVDLAGPTDTIHLQPTEDGVVEIRYVGTFKNSERPDGSAGIQGPSRIPSRVIDSRGIFLTGAWYPKPERMCDYQLTATLPAAYEAVSEAETVTTTRQEGSKSISFRFPHPLDSLTFIATSRYQVTQDRFNDTEIYAYFFPEDEKLAQSYIEGTKKFLKMYQDLIGKYPYRRFSVVENFLPTGYSMPTYTVLGQDVVRLPFIVNTSLGHEILHQWFGNSVYVDPAKGNWAEGLTSYLSDHFYEEKKGKGAEYRKGALLDYESYVSSKTEFPLKSFRGRENRASQAIGYGKALLVFHMLKKKLGQERFYESLRHFVSEMRFRQAGWEDLQRVFQEVSRKDLKSFFREWVDGKGLAELGLEPGVKVTPENGKFEVRFTVTQKKAYRIDLPVSFYSNLGRVSHILGVDREKNPLRVLLDSYPQKMVIDEDYEVARTLAPRESPPVIARLLGGEPPLVVLPASEEDFYQPVVDYFKRKGSRVEGEGRVKDADLRDSSLVILGGKNALAERLFGGAARTAGFDLTVKENPLNPKRLAGIFQARSKKEAEDGFPKIFHYGKYSEVSFEKGRNLKKQTEPAERGIVKEISGETAAIERDGVKNLAAVLPQIEDRRIVYVGENHDRFAHHVVQLEIVKALRRKGKKVAIGMEMFQRPFQKDLDDYVEGRTEEKEFLKKSEYFSRWRFDYNLYRPILQFARMEKIPVVALNVPTEIVEKVARSGFDSLSEEEKKIVPLEMDFSDGEYRDRLRGIFAQHKAFPETNFDFFYQAQILWDEAMAEAVDIFLKKNPEHRMVVLAGNGHLAFGSGIPKRAARRNGLEYSILLNDAEIEKGAADYILFPAAIPMEGSPKLMVSLQEEKGQVSIAGFSEGSVSQKAGLQKGDILLSLDEIPVRTVEDVRLELLFKKRGEPVKVKVTRKELIGKDKEMEFEVIPQ